MKIGADREGSPELQNDVKKLVRCKELMADNI